MTVTTVIDRAEAVRHCTEWSGSLDYESSHATKRVLESCLEQFGFAPEIVSDNLSYWGWWAVGVAAAVAIISPISSAVSRKRYKEDREAVSLGEEPWDLEEALSRHELP